MMQSESVIMVKTVSSFFFFFSLQQRKLNFRHGKNSKREGKIESENWSQDRDGNI